MTSPFTIKLQDNGDLFVVEIKTYVLSFLLYHLCFYYDTSLRKDIQNLVLERNLGHNPVQPPHFTDVKGGDMKLVAQELTVLAGEAVLDSSFSDVPVPPLSPCHSASSGTKE